MKGGGDDLFVRPVGRTDIVNSPLLVSANSACRRGRKHGKGLFLLLCCLDTFNSFFLYAMFFAPQNKRIKETWLHTEVHT